MNLQPSLILMPAAFLAVMAAGGAWILGMVIAGEGFPEIALAPTALLAAGIGLSLFIAAAAGSRRGVAALLVLVAFGLSISFRVRDYGETGIDLQNGIKLVVWLLIPVVAIMNLRRIMPLLREPAVIMALVFALVALSSTLWSQTTIYTGASALGVASYLLLACLAITTLGEAALLRLLVFALAAFAVLALASGGLLPDRAWLASTGYIAPERLQGLSGHPNVLGEQMAVLITLAAIARRQRLITRAAFFLCLALGLVILDATSSRTMLAAVLIAWGLVALRERGLLWLALVTVAIAVSAFILALAMGYNPVPETMLASLSRTGSTSELLTLTGRTELWQVALDLIRERPLLGWGYNGTEELFVSNVGRAFYGDPVNAHNMYLQSIVTLGLLGALPVFAMLALLAARVIAKPDPARDQIVLLVLIIGVAEVGIAATPAVLTLVFFIFVAREALKPSVASLVPSELPSHGFSAPKAA